MLYKPRRFIRDIPMFSIQTVDDKRLNWLEEASKIKQEPKGQEAEIILL